VNARWAIVQPIEKKMNATTAEITVNEIM
jgi:hypothetical protein